MKSTPGPWRTGPINYADVYGANGELVALVPKGTENTIDDARLIACAPELLKALKAVLEDTIAPVNTLAMMRAEALIAKVENNPATSPEAPERQETAS